MRFLRSLYFHQRLFYAIFILAAGFLFSFWLPWLYPIISVLSVILLLFLLCDLLLLFRIKGVHAERVLPDKFSNSDENVVEVRLRNDFPFPLIAEIIDEIPVQFQKRDFRKILEVPKKRESHFNYYLRPVERGNYIFGNLNIFCSTFIGLARKKAIFGAAQQVKVYPSFQQMKQYELLALDRRIQMPGMKKIRKIGHTMEFEQIRDYVMGDDIRSINWKATAKQGNLMINQFQDERSQPVYAVIDTGRSMKMPFNNLKLLDYAINSTLALSNIVLRKKDKAGLISFSNKMELMLAASSKRTHLNLLMESLYSIDTRFLDSDFGLLYSNLKRQLTQRSLLLLYTNFEHLSALHRQLPYLLALSRQHLLVVIFFENTELEQLIEMDATTIPEIFDQTIAEQFSYDKKLMARELQKHGIQTILTRPEELSLNTINKYLEIKKRGIL